MRRMLVFVVLLVVSVLVLQACGGGNPPVDDITVSIKPEAVTLEPGATQEFTATVTGTSNTAVAWDVTGGTVEGSGNTITYTAPATEGEYTLTATSTADDSKQATATIYVTTPDGSGARIEIVSDDALLLTKAGETDKLEAVVYRADGSVDTTADVTWISEEPSVVSVSSTGVVTALKDVGYVWITASYGSLPPAQASVAIADPAPETEIIDPAAVQSVDYDNRTLVLRETSATTALQAGDIVASDVGLLARVTGVTHENGQVLADIAPVTLIEAFDKLKFGGSTGPIDFSLVASEVGLTVIQTHGDITTQKDHSYKDFECTSEGNGVTIDYQGPSITMGGPNVNVVFNAKIDKNGLLPNTGYLDFYVDGNLGLEAATGKFTFEGNVGGSVRCEFTLVELEIPVASFYGFVNVDVGLDPVIGFEGEVTFDAGSFVIEGPTFDIGYHVKAGARYDVETKKWTPYKDVDQTGDGFSPITISSRPPSGFSATMGPFLEVPISLNVEAGWFDVAGVQLTRPKLSAPFETGILGVLEKASKTYEGPYWSASLLAQAGINFTFTGGVGKLLDHLGINVAYQQTLFEKEWSLAHSPEPSITASTTNVTDSVTLTSEVTPDPDLIGTKVEFWALKEGSDTAFMVAQATLDMSGRAMATWSPDASRNGEYKIYALLYAGIYSSINLPYASNTRVAVVVDGTPNPGGASDLIIQNLSVSPTSGAPGDTVTVTFDIVNQGDATSAASTTHININDNPDDATVNYTVLNEFTLDPLAPSASQSFEKTVTIPEDLAEGQYYIWAIADVGSTANQSDETNDKEKTSITVGTASACTDPSQVVNIPDGNLEAAIRNELNKSSGEVTCADMASLTNLTASSQSIQNLEGLQYATNLKGLFLFRNQISNISLLATLTNLTILSLYENQISDLSPLANLTDLTHLALGHNQINNLSPLVHLTSLTELYLYENQISDLSPLASLANLGSLNLSANQISDLSPLVNLTDLTVLSLNENPISDLSPLAGLTKLTDLHLRDNQISDISPIVSNSGIGDGDFVYVQGNCLDLSSSSEDLANINALLNRGVNLTYEPQNACGSSGNPVVIELEGHTGSITSVTFTPDGSRVVTGSEDATARVWDAETGEELLVLDGHAGPVNAVAIWPDGQSIVTGSSDKFLRIWSASGDLSYEGEYPLPIFSVALSPDGKKLMVGTGTLTLAIPPRPSVYLFDLETGGGPIHVLGEHGTDGFYVDVAYSPTEGKLLTGLLGVYSGHAKLWDAISGAQLFELKSGTRISSVAFSPDGTKALAGSDYFNEAYLWDVATGEEITTLMHAAGVNDVAFSPDGTIILTGSADGNAYLWNAATGEQLNILSGHTDEVTAVAFSPDGSKILTSSKDNTARLWKWQ